MRLAALFVLACVAVSAQTVPLSQLVSEAEAHSPEVAAAAAAVRATEAGVAPAGSLPDPQVMLQQMNVGNPLPFAGFRSNDFAYLGLGVAQSLPYPGKRKLRAQAARDAVAMAQAKLAQVRRDLRRQVAEAVVALGLPARERSVLVAQQQALDALAHLAATRYAAGTAAQADVLAAQLEQTRILRELAAQRERADAARARMQSLLGRGPGSPPIEVEALQPSPLPLPETPTISASPVLAVGRAEVQAADTRIALARKDFLPDFHLQGMVQRTSTNFPDYYQWSVGINLPIHRKSRLEPELERAAQEKLEAEASLRAMVRQNRLLLDESRLQVESDQRLMHLNRSSLLPQVRATATARLAAYGAGTGVLAEVMDSERDALTLEMQYWTTVADRETALARIAWLTGADHE